MDITKIIGVGIVGIIAAVTIKSYRPELAMCVAIVTGVVIFSGILPELAVVVGELLELCRNSEITAEYIGIILKVTGIAYITQFAAELAKDAGEGAIAKKLEFAGKVSVLFVIMPTIKNLIGVITGALMSF